MASPNNRTIQSENKDTGYFSLSGPRTLTVSAAFRHSPIVPAEVTRGDASDPSDPTFAYVSQTIPAFETFRSLDTEALPSQSLPSASAKAFGLSLEGEPVDLAEATEGEWTACSVPSAGEPPSAPCYLERATCFITGVLPTILMTFLCSALTKHPKCRFSKTEEYQVAGEATQNHNALQFNIAVYRDAPGKQLVEVQRLYGDRFSFNDFFHNLCDELDNVVLHRFSVRLPRSPQLSLDLQFVHSAVDRLASMILAQERDVAREGAKGLLLLTAEAQAQIELDTVIEAIKAGSASDDWEVNRCIATILSAISAHPQHRSSVMVNHECFAAMHALFSGQQESHAFETKMEVCRALLNLAETFGRKLLAQSAVKDILEAGCNEKDSYVRETLNRVRVCVGLA